MDGADCICRSENEWVLNGHCHSMSLGTEVRSCKSTPKARRCLQGYLPRSKCLVGPRRPPTENMLIRAAAPQPSAEDQACSSKSAVQKIAILHFSCTNKTNSFSMSQHHVCKLPHKILDAISGSLIKNSL